MPRRQAIMLSLAAGAPPIHLLFRAVRSQMHTALTDNVLAHDVEELGSLGYLKVFQ